MLEFVRDELKPDMFIWTGDNSPHNVWDITMDDSILSTINVTRMIKSAFNGTNISTFAIQGNHDTWPVNTQNFSEAE